jgi:pseudaminic acid synthase
MNKKVKINNKVIESGSTPYVIAEISANHNGDIGRAFEMIEAAKECGADAVKIQSYTPDSLTIPCDKTDFKIVGGLWDGYTLYELYREAHTPYSWHHELFEKAKDVGITIFSTPFDEYAVDLLEELKVPAYKVASFEMTDHNLLKYVARTNKPVILSTGMANKKEIAGSIDVLRGGGCESLVVMHCISAYPAPIHEANLATMVDIANSFDVLTGLSDHTLGVTASIAAAALGAAVIEKHFTLSRHDGGADAPFSIEPHELKELCSSVKDARLAVGRVSYNRSSKELSNLVFRRSIYAVKNIRKGEVFTKKNIRSIRPGFGLPPYEIDNIIGLTAESNIEYGSAIDKAMICDKHS